MNFGKSNRYTKYRVNSWAQNNVKEQRDLGVPVHGFELNKERNYNFDGIIQKTNGILSFTSQHMERGVIQ